MNFPAMITRAAIDLLFPPVCAVCGRRLRVSRPGSLCPDCLGRVRFLEEPLCPVCGMEQTGGEAGRGHLCGTCLSRPPSYDLARSLVVYEQSVRQLVHTLKYGGHTFVTAALGELIARGDLALFADCEAIVPVPLHLARLRLRGLNQAAVLARLFFPASPDLIRPDGLIRIRNTVAQTELRGRDRRKNLRNAIKLNTAAFNPSGSIVCLVDDVFTTGTTVEECSRVLKKHGAREVKVITLARAGLRGGR